MKTRISLLAILLAIDVSALAQAPTAPPRVSPQQRPDVTGGITVGQVAEASSLPLTVPYTVIDGLITVKASLADGLPVDAVIMTSLPVTVASPALASKQSIHPEGIRDVPTLYGTVRASAVKPQLIHIGRLTISNVASCVFDVYGKLSGAPKADAPPLWLGASALSAVAITIDPERSEVTFRAQNAILPRNAIAVPFEIKDGQLFAEIKINDKKVVPMLIDTGASGTLLPSDIAKGLKLVPASTMKAKHPNGKECTVAMTRLAELSMGPAKVKDALALYVSEGDTAGMNSGPGVLGTDILLHFRTTIHYGLHRLILEPLKSAAQTASAAGSTPDKPSKGKDKGKKKPDAPAVVPTP